MITEDYVSLEIAKLLKEKGFNWNCDEYYTKNGSTVYTQLRFNHNDTKNRYNKPTLQMAMKWLREVHHIYFDIHPRIILEQWSGYDITAYSFDENGFYKKQTVIKGLKDDTPHEEAVEAAIKYCLTKLI